MGSDVTPEFQVVDHAFLELERDKVISQGDRRSTRTTSTSQFADRAGHERHDLLVSRAFATLMAKSQRMCQIRHGLHR